MHCVGRLHSFVLATFHEGISHLICSKTKLSDLPNSRKRAQLQYYNNIHVQQRVLLSPAMLCMLRMTSVLRCDVLVVHNLAPFTGIAKLHLLIPVLIMFYKRNK